MITKVREALRINGTAFTEEITDLIAAAKSDLQLAGVAIIDEADPMIIRAVNTYCKANFGWDNPDRDRLMESYESLKMHLSQSVDYAYYTVIFEVKDGLNAVRQAEVTFNGDVKHTDSLGVTTFYVRKSANLEYTVIADGFQTVEGLVDVSANTTIPISVVV